MLVVVACTGGPAPTNPTPLTATGVVIAADGPNAAEVETFSLRIASGIVLEFTVGRLDLSNGGLPSAHLREHMVSGEAIVVAFHLDADGIRIADRYTDVNGPANGPTLPPTVAPTPTVQPTPTRSPKPTAQPTEPLPFRLAIEPFADGFTDLTFLANAGDGSGDVYAVEQRGVIWRMAADGTLDRTPFLNIADRISCCDERGLLGLAFHPDFADNGRLFVDYTDLAGNTVVSEFGLASDGYGDPDSERALFGIDQPFPNHNGGMLAFGSDGYLYIGTGDGGDGGDPMGNGQNLVTMLAKILRIDIDSGDPYAIPEGNPYSIPASNPFQAGNSQGALPEIWDWGMRNPWRFSFDRETGDLWIGDVGQDIYEELDAEVAGAGGHNYGWNTMEATYCYLHPMCDQQGLTLPVAEYGHGQSCAIIGGYVYRGTAYPELIGQYVFSDLCSGNLWAIDAADALASGSATLTEYGVAPINPTGFGEDEAGELYLVNGAGQIFRLTAD